MLNKLSICIVIPMYNDFDRLYVCLQSILDSVVPELTIKVYVVDNNSSDKLEISKLSKYCESVDIFNFLSEESPGSYNARNKALKIIKNEFDFVYFTDSDCVVKIDWPDVFSLYSDVLEKKDTLLAGKIKLFSVKKVFAECYDRIFAFPQQFYVANSNFGVTANLLVPTDIINVVGPFNTDAYSGGDKEFCNRVVTSGFNIVYAEELLVMHPARSSLRDLLIKNIRAKKGHLIREKKKSRFSIRLLRSVFRIIPRFDMLFKRLLSRPDEGFICSINAVVIFLFLQMTVSFYEIFFVLGVDLYDPR